MNSFQIDEIILVSLCCAPFVVIGVFILYLLLTGDPCEESSE